MVKEGERKGSLRDRDSLSTRDKSHFPKVVLVRRHHCIIERCIMIAQTSSRMLIGHIIFLISSLASSLTDTVHIIHGMWNLLAFMSMDSYNMNSVRRRLSTTKCIAGITPHPYIVLTWNLHQVKERSLPVLADLYPS